MAPVGMVDMLGWFSSPEVGVISLMVLLVLSITLIALCARCSRTSGNAYDVNNTTQTDGAGVANGTRSGAADPGRDASSNWRDHKLPPSTLDRPTN